MCGEKWLNVIGIYVRYSRRNNGSIRFTVEMKMDSKMSVRFRYATGGLGIVSVFIVTFVNFAPFWRNTSQQTVADIFDSVYLFEGLWLNCLFQERRVECIEMGVGWSAAYGVSYYEVRRLMSKFSAFVAFALKSVFEIQWNNWIEFKDCEAHVVEQDVFTLLVTNVFHLSKLNMKRFSATLWQIETAYNLLTTHMNSSLKSGGRKKTKRKITPSL